MLCTTPRNSLETIMKCLVLLFLVFGAVSAGALKKRLMWTKDGSLCRGRGGSCTSIAACTGSSCILPIEDMDCPSGQTCCTACSGSSPNFVANCGQQNATTRIVGGKESTRWAWPWMGLVLRDARLLCGATLINNQWLIGAAHCFEGDNIALTRFNITLGDHDRTVNHGTEQRFYVDKIVVNPNYDDDEIQNDIALIKIRGMANFNNYVQPVCVPNPGTSFAGMTCPTIGWGRTTENGVTSNVLRDVALPILTDAACIAKFPRDLITPDTQVCAGVNGANKDSCQGDSGGPLNCQMNGRWQHTGITSWGYGCLNGGVYTRVSAFKTWVQSVISTL